VRINRLIAVLTAAISVVLVLGQPARADLLIKITKRLSA
jgi:hypothetical protein